MAHRFFSLTILLCVWVLIASGFAQEGEAINLESPTENLQALQDSSVKLEEFIPLSKALDAGEKPTPFYQRLLDSLFNLITPDDPYMRDNLAVILGTSIGYDDNVFYSSTNRITSPTYGVNAALDYHFGSRRLRLAARLDGSINYYENRPGGSNDQNYVVRLTLDYILMPRLGVNASTYTAYLSRPSPQLIGGVFQYTGSYFYTDTSFGLEYQVRPRLGLTLGYEVSGLKYDDEAINQSSGFYQQNFSLMGNWLCTPRTTLILQYRYNPVTYYEAGLGSTGQFLLVGFRQLLSPRLNYKLLFGAEYRTLENPTPNSPTSYLGPFLEGDLEYHFAPRSVLNGGLRFGTEPSGTAGVTIRRTFRASLSASHAVGSRVTFDASVSYEHDAYDQPGVIADFTQDIYSAALSFRYQFALATSVVLRDEYLFLESSTPNGSYTRNYVSAGLEVVF